MEIVNYFEYQIQNYTNKRRNTRQKYNSFSNDLKTFYFLKRNTQYKRIKILLEKGRRGLLVESKRGPKILKRLRNKDVNNPYSEFDSEELVSTSEDSFGLEALIENIRGLFPPVVGLGVSSRAGLVLGEL